MRPIFSPRSKSDLISTVSLLSLVLFPASTTAWAWASHDVIQPFAAQTSNAITSRFQPLLRVENGCVPFPAVDVINGGRAGGGLGTSGAIDGGCSSSTGQVYARSGVVDGTFAVLYAWYFPKDQILLGPLGHRHDWESFVILYSTSTPTTASQILAICPSRHGGAPSNYYCDKSSSLKLSGLRPKMVYRPDGTHALFTYSGTSGLGSHPLVNWESLPTLARQILTEGDWGSANVPFKDGAWEGNVRSAKTAAGL